MHLKKVFTAALLCATFLASHSFANVNNEDEWDVDDEDWVSTVLPTSYTGLRGLRNTSSAEALGAGWINLAVGGAWFKQDQTLPSIADRNVYAENRNDALQKGANVYTMRLAIALGLNNIDIFAGMPMYAISGETEKTSSMWTDVGQFMGGIQMTAPLPEELPIRLAGQLRLNYGFRIERSFNAYDVTTNLDYVRDGGEDGNSDKFSGALKSYAGYDFMEARKNEQMDLIFGGAITLLGGNVPLKLHINPALLVTPGIEDWLMLVALGLQYDATDNVTLGVEYNYRTIANEFNKFDPMWLTLSAMWRTPYYANGLMGMSFIGGADIRVGPTPGKRDDGTDLTRSLEPFRLFADVVFAFDRYASKRAEIVRKARQDAAEKAGLARKAQLSEAQRDSIARQAREDSLRLANEMAERAHADSLRAKAIADSLAALRSADSIAAAQREASLLADAEQAEQKRVADSLEFARRLAEERAKRSEMEQNLLSTGMIVLGGVYFETGRAVVHRNSEPYLETIAKMLVKYPKLKLEIGGHTDATGRLETNMTLSQQRADAVFMFMQRIEPGLAQMLVARGYGPTMPKADNNTAAGREANRRVELKVLNPEVLQEYNP